MKILVISDLHYAHRVFRGFDEGRAWYWLMKIVDYHRPNILLSCGDWGNAVSREEFYELLRKCVVLTIYGNHENMDVLSSLYNVKSSTHLPVLMEDGEVYEISGLRISGINGIVAPRGGVKRGVPRKKPEEYLEVARKLKGKIDVLLIHETPYLPRIHEKQVESVGAKTALESVKIVKPKIVFNGHIHWSPYSIYRFPYHTLYVRIDSSQQHKTYAIFYPSTGKVEIWANLEKQEENMVQL